MYLELVAKYHKSHRKLLEESINAGCYFCCKVYPASEIKEWIKTFRRTGESPDCALCPKCGIDAVLPDSKVTLSSELLKELNKYWFSYN